MIPHNKPTLGETEAQIANDIICSGWVAQGQQVDLFENEFCEYLGLDYGHALAVSSCTAATYLALLLSGAIGKPIGMPAYTCTAVRNAVGHIGSEILVDSGSDTPNIDINELNNKDLHYAVVPHMYGIMAAVEHIREDIFLIEDCAQSLGAEGHRNGNIRNIGVFSFYATKIMTSGGMGGMLVARDKNLIQEARDYRDFDQKIDDKRRFNFQMTDIQAGIGRVQLSLLPEFISRRWEIYNKYKAAGINLLAVNECDVPFRAIMLTDDIETKINRLASSNIKAINPMENIEIMQNFELSPVAHSWATKTLSLPIYPSLTDDDVDYIIREVKKL